MAFDKKLLDILACPICKAKLTYNEADQELICKFENVAYRIENDIPVLLASEARKLNQEA